MVETLVEKLVKIERGENQILKIFPQFIQPGDDMHVSDMVLLGIIKRTLALSEGFRGHVQSKNFTCAAALLRMQLDTALRVFAATLYSSPEQYAIAVFEGRKVDRLKDRNGNRLTDSYLAKKLSELYPWVERVYKDLCDFVHFSNRHIFTSIAKLDDATRTVYFQVSAKDAPRSDDDYFEVVDAYYEILRITGTLAGGWQASKRPERLNAAFPDRLA